MRFIVIMDFIEKKVYTTSIKEIQDRIVLSKGKTKVIKKIYNEEFDPGSG